MTLTRAESLRDTARRHIRAVNLIVDKLVKMGAEKELRQLAIALQQAAFRAMPSSGK